ncbi:MAG: VCBS repeat-containing protein [Bacteroidetes bacterium]|nr:VCBS repeat-containing protein [Bacteroidota bacterium]
MRKIFMLAMLAFSTNAFAQIPTNGLIAYYPFNGDLKDETANSYDGVNNGVTFINDRFGNTNSAISFNGSSWVVLPNQVAITGGGSRSIFAWVKFSVLSTYSFVSTGPHTNTNGFELMNSYPSSPTVCAFTSINNDLMPTSGANIGNNMWHFIGVTYDSLTNNLSLYVDGVLDNFTTSLIPLNTIALSNYLGRCSNPGTIASQTRYTGYMDDVSFYNRALTGLEIDTLFNNPNTIANQLCFGTATNYSTLSNPSDIISADFNGDGKLDIAIANYGANTFSVRLGTGTGNFGASTNFTVGTGPRGIISADFNGDGKMDIATSNRNSNNISVLLGNGIGGFGTAVNYSTGSQPQDLISDDFNGDGKADLAVANTNTTFVSILLGNGIGGFGAITNYTTLLGCGEIISADFNGDTYKDLVLASNLGSNNIVVLLGNGTGSFASSTYFYGTTSPTCVVSGDFNGDAKLDLAVTDFYSNNVAILIGTGTGSFGLAMNYSSGGTSAWKVICEDFNNDGEYDLATANNPSTTTPISILLGDGTGSFNNSLNIGNVKTISLVSADFNVDGKMDIATTNDVANTTSVLLNCSCNVTATFIAQSSTTFCANSSVTFIANTGIGLTYQWNLNTVAITGATNSSYIANQTGNYDVQVINGNCSATSLPVNVSVIPLPTSTITASGSTTFCQGGNVVLNANTGTGLTYQWFNGTSISGATNASYTATQSGSYTVQVSNSNSCSATSLPQNVTVNPLPTSTVTASGPTTFCQGGNVVLNANTGTGLTYQWFNGTSISGATNASYTATQSGSYTVQVSNSNSCSATSLPQNVTVNPLPTSTVTASGPTTFCQGGSVVLNANTGTGLTYQWFNGTSISGATNASYTATQSGSYTVQVTNSNSCSSTSLPINVTVNPLPTSTATASGPTTFCQGGNVLLNANTGTGLTYQWFNGTSISGATNASYSATQTGNYTVQVTNLNSCSSTSLPIIVIVNPLPASTVTVSGPTTFCQGGNVVLNANTGTGLTYQWFNGTSISGATNASYTATQSGSYTVQVSNSNSCSATSLPQNVTVNPLPTSTVTASGPTTFCQGGSVVLNANTGTGLTYQWFNGTSISGATNASYTATQSGSYTVQVTNSNSCSATSLPLSVTVNTLPTSTITASGPTTFCQGDSVVLNANTGTGLTYQWFNGTSISGATNASYTATQTGSYTVQVTNSNSCSATSLPVSVTVTPLPNPIIINTGGLLSVSGGPYTSYQWYWNGTLISGATNSTYTPTKNGSYYVIVTKEGCDGTSPIINLTGVGIEDISANNLNIFISPNPTNGIITITGIKPYRIEVLNFQGQIVKVVYDVTELSISDISNGIYLLKLYGKDGHQLLTKKVLKN